MSSFVTRRDFLKLLLAGSLVRLGWPKARPKLIDPAPAQQDQSRPNVLVLVFDTFSAPHSSIYGYFRETTPNLARFADRATVYHRHYAAGNFTSSGTASLLTGTYPWSHRAFNIRSTVDQSYAGKNLFSSSAGGYHRVAYTHSSLAMVFLNQFKEHLDFTKPLSDLFLASEVFSDQYFRKDLNTADFGEQLIFPRDVRLPTSLFLSLVDEIGDVIQLNGLERTYGDLFPRGFPSADEEGRIFILEHAIDWLMSELKTAPQPFLFYCHLLPPHEPYRPRREFSELFRDQWLPVLKNQHFFAEGIAQAGLNQRRRTYDRYLAYVDAEFGRLYDAMVQMGITDNTTIIVTSDHGQMFERGIHGHITPTLYNPILNIPLLISRPGQQEREDIYLPTSAVDVLPTVINLTGGSRPDWVEGQILPPFASQPDSQARSLFALDAKRNFRDNALTVGTAAMIKDRYKLIHYFGYDNFEDTYELYDLENDVEEIQDLYSLDSTTAGALQEELTDKLADVNRPYTDG